MNRISRGSKESRQKLANTKQTNKQNCLMRVCMPMFVEKPQWLKIINKFHLSNEKHSELADGCRVNKTKEEVKQKNYIEEKRRIRERENISF